jgi:hypothetical protein
MELILALALFWFAHRLRRAVKRQKPTNPPSIRLEIHVFGHFPGGEPMPKPVADNPGSSPGQAVVPFRRAA